MNTSEDATWEFMDFRGMKFEDCIQALVERGVEREFAHGLLLYVDHMSFKAGLES